jgi:hypothetical protein
MHPLYDRMADGVTELKLDEDKVLARLLLTWAMYAKTSVTIEELLEVYSAELGSLMDINHYTPSARSGGGMLCLAPKAE